MLFLHPRFLVLGLAILPFAVKAQKTVQRSPESKSISLSCSESTAQVDLDINNVRARILGSADMWWDLANGVYEIPKGSGINSIFAGALWIGAIDQGGQLRVAAQTYRQTGTDFWPGPMDTVNHQASDSACWKYDRVWKVDRFMVKEFIQNYKSPGYNIPKDILEWPGNGDAGNGETHYLAPFVDVNGDGKYNPYDGDYPGYDFTGNQNCEFNLLGDQTLWWVFNDAADIHTESGGAPLGLEIQAQAFAYQAADEINDATFYQYKVINRSVNTLDSMIWGQYVDVDLGCYTDDFTACDVKRGMGYVYNGDSLDEIACASWGYGLHPPAVGVDFLGGPLAVPGDGIDNDRDSVIDEPGERTMMWNLHYPWKGIGPMGPPSGPVHFYNYLKGIWGDGTPKTYGGAGYASGGVKCTFFYPGDTDPYGWGTGGIQQAPWTEENSGNTPSDRRMLMATGNFKMLPGEIQFITHGVVWARDMNGDNYDAIVALQKVDDKAQALFDQCFSMPCQPPVAKINYTINEREVFFGAHCHGDNYYWDFGDGTTSTDQFPKHTYAANGKYLICMKASSSCGVDSTCISIRVENDPPPPWGFRLKRIEGNGNGGRKLKWLQQNHDSVLKNGRVLNPVYDYLNSPVYVAAYDTTLLPNGTFVLKFDTIGPDARWKLYLKGSTDTVFSDSTISADHVQFIPQWGIQVKEDTSYFPGNSKTIDNGFLDANMEVSASEKNWLDGLRDSDIKLTENWIRAGTVSGTTGYQNDYIGIDNNQNFEQVLSGTWAPYRLCAASDVPVGFDPQNRYYTGPGFKGNLMGQVLMNELASVEVIITPDKNKWSRCVVLEMCEDSIYTAVVPGISKRARKHDFRRAPSVNKNGTAAVIGSGASSNPDDPNFISDVGMGWFPGYAVNLETGERLNIAFGENSALGIENGNDMLWNPTSTRYATTYNVQWDTVGQPFGSPVFGGQHYIFVFGHNKMDDVSGSITPNDTINVPVYDSGKRIKEILSWAKGLPQDVHKREVFRDCMWANIPLLNPGRTLLEDEVRIRINVTKPYAKGFSNVYWQDGLIKYLSDTLPFWAAQNRNYPMYEFESHDFGPKTPVLTVSGHQLFPNPFIYSAQFLFENPDAEMHDLRVFDMQGNLVKHYKNLTGQSVIIERGSLRAGVYFYALYAGKKRKGIGKFVVGSKE